MYHCVHIGDFRNQRRMAFVHEMPKSAMGKIIKTELCRLYGGNTNKYGRISMYRRAHIGGYKIPRRMAFVAELPKSAMGKILKTELRRIYRSGQHNS